MAKPGLGAPLGAQLPKLTPEIKKTLRSLAEKLDRERIKRERQNSAFFGRCGCPSFCYFHSGLGRRI